MIVTKTTDRERYENYREPVSADVATLNINVETGSIVIQTHDVSRVDVAASLRDVDVHVWREDNDVFVTAENTAMLVATETARPKAELVIMIPATCAVRAHVLTGSLEINDLSAAAHTHVITGQTNLNNLQGRITASSVTGSIRYEGRLVEDIHRFVATRGSLRLTLHEPPNARIYAWATTGRVHCDLPLSRQRRGGYPTGDHLYGVAGQGVGRIITEVITGSVHIAAT